MRTILWTDAASLGLAELSEKQRIALISRLDLVAEFPAMYPARQRGRFAGLRFFQIQRRWLVYYRYTQEHVQVIAILPALSRPR